MNEIEFVWKKCRQLTAPAGGFRLASVTNECSQFQLFELETHFVCCKLNSLNIHEFSQILVQCNRFVNLNRSSILL
jgi:hypothetical protein